MQRTRTVEWCGVAVAALMAAAAAPLLGQAGEITGEVVVRVEEEGTGVAGLPVNLYNEGKSETVGTTGSDGSTVLDMGLVDIVKGTPVEVVVRNCEGERQIILVPRGETLPEDEDCDDVVVGAFPWGETESVTVRITETGGTLVTEGPGPTGFGHLVSLGAKADLAYWTNLDEVVGAVPGLSSSEVDEQSLLVSAFGEVSVWGPITVGASFTYSQYEFQQVSSSGAAVDGEVDVYGLGGYGSLRAPATWPVRPFGLVGVEQLWNDLTFTRGLDDPLERSENGPRLRFGGGLDFSLTNGLGFRTNVDYVSGGDQDADAHWRFGGGPRFDLRF